MTEKHRSIITISIILIAIVFLWFVLCGANKREVVRYDYISGTSLWDLARNCPEDMDKRKYIIEIKELNDMKNDIVYANRLYQVPIYE